MATSGVYAITVTGTSMFTDILRLLGVLGSGQTANADDIDLVKNRCNQWLIQHNGPNNTYRTGNMMWTRESATLTLSTSDASYDFQPSGGDLDIQIPYEIISVVYRDANGDDTPLTQMTEIEKDHLFDKDATGTPQQYHYEKRLTKGVLTLDVVPDTANSLIIKYKQPLELISSLANNFDIDPCWHRYVLFGVAVDVAPFFDIEITDPKFKTVSTLAQQAMDVVNSFYPDNEPIQMRLA